MGGGTIIRLDVYGPERSRPDKKATAPVKKKRTVPDREWLAANKRKQKKRPGTEDPALKSRYLKETKRRSRRAKKSRAKVK